VTDASTNAATALLAKGAGRAMAGTAAALSPLAATDGVAWRRLAARAAEPNGYFLPDWELAVDAHAEGRGGAAALSAFAGGELVALLPVTSLRRATGLPLPALASADPYGVLGTPLLDGTAPVRAATALLAAARTTPARALLLRDVPLDGAALAALREALAADALAPLVLRRYARAALDASQPGETTLAAALSGRKLKELRRQEKRLAEHGPLAFTVARSPDDTRVALETFLALEAGGWKGQRGTALGQRPGDAAFIRAAVPALAGHGQCEIVLLSAGATPVAGGIVLRQRDRAFWFKIGVDERFAKFSPGVQLALQLTRHLCDDGAIALADSTAAPGHPMIDPIWRERLVMGDVLLPLRRRDPLVPLIAAALQARSRMRGWLRDAVHAAKRRLRPA
jgi:CelD/BcsL family acetyltransferase involved in cellulose biosynthesis